MYSGIVHAHSGIRWVLLAFLVITIVLALVKWTGKKPFWEQHKKLALYTFISSHIQLLFGLILYFISPKVIFSAESMKDPIARFHLVEHLVGMIIAIALISVGYIRAKKQLPEQSSKTIFWFYFIAFVIIMATIPWPFRPYSGSWF